MHTLKKQVVALILILSQTASVVLAETNEAFQFFAEEAKVVTSVSRQPQKLDQASATVYVVTSEEIKDSGATTLWDALRNVPGLDVITARTADGNVSVRGLDQPFNARTLVLIDGRTAANSFNDFPQMSEFPVSLDEIDRVEVVEGPASAVYGPNAVNGVINIITKTPKQLDGGVVHYTGGSDKTHIGTIAYGHESEKMKYKVGTSYDHANSLADSSRLALSAWKSNFLYGWMPSANTELDISAGFTQLHADYSAGTAGIANLQGHTNFARLDYRWGDTKFLSYWNSDRKVVDVSAISPHEIFNADRFYNSLQQAFHLPFKNEAVAGVEYTHLHSDVSIYGPGQRARDLWALFAEDHWDINDKLALMGNARVDSNPLTPTMFSSLGSLIYTPVTDQTVRASAGQSFRNPDRGQTDIDTFIGSNHLVGKRDLDPERLREEEIAYRGRFGSFKPGLTGFHYLLKDVIASSGLTFANAGEIEAWGGEVSLDYLVNPHLTTFANYSMQDVQGDVLTTRILARQSPRHKVNTGFRFKHSGWTTGMAMHWVDSTYWRNYSAVGGGATNAYFMMDANVGYAFRGRYQGLEVGVSALNLLNHRHYEFSHQANATAAGQRGEMIGNRWTGSVSYRF